jgi:S-formylglutathione hydrolase FrmB
MHRLLLVPIVLFLVGSALLPAQRRRWDDRMPEFRHVEYRNERFESPALGGREQAYGVFLPIGYDDEENADETYPLVIWLHGLFEDHRRFAFRGGGEVLDEMIGDGDFPPCVFVCAEGDRSSFWLDAGEDRNYESMVVEDLLAHLEKTYRIREERGQRAITGTSMGGLGALKIALKHPDAFGTVSVHSAAILPRDPKDIEREFPALRRAGRIAESLFGDPIDIDRYEAENPLCLVDEADPEILSALKIRFDCGSNDRYGFAKTNVRLHEALEEREIDHEWLLVEDGDHGWGSGYNQAALPAALRFLARSFATESGLSGLGGLLPGGTDAGSDDDGGKQPDAGKSAPKKDAPAPGRR